MWHLKIEIDHEKRGKFLNFWVFGKNLKFDLDFSSNLLFIHSYIHSTRYNTHHNKEKQMVLRTILRTTIQWDRILLPTLVLKCYYSSESVASSSSSSSMKAKSSSSVKKSKA